MKNSKSVEDYLNAQQHRVEELKKLRAILKQTELVETIKWGMPTYTLKGKNIVGIGAFKDWSCLWFHEGALLSDPEKKLVNAQEGKTKALRQWRFSDIGDIDESLIHFYLKEAIENHKNGRRVEMKRKEISHKDIIIPPLLKELFKDDKSLVSAFNQLTYAQRRDYCEYIRKPKKESTKQSRLEKIIPLIRSGKPIAALWAK